MNATCTVLELMGIDEPVTSQKSFDEMDPDNRFFLRTMKRDAAEDNIELHFHIHPLQKFRMQEPQKLSEEQFDADYAVCMYPDITHVGPELGYLMLDRRKSFRHVFVVTHQYSPDSENKSKRGLNPITTHSFIHYNARILSPAPLRIIDSEEEYDAESANILSYWKAKQIREQSARECIRSILMFA